MKKRVLWMAVCLLAGVVTLAACSTPADTQGGSESSTSDSAPSSVTTDSAGTTPSVTSEPAPAPAAPAVALDLSFPSTQCCSSSYDPKAAGKEGKLSVYDRWYSTDYMDISAYYGLYYELAGHKYLMPVAFYNAEKEYIGGVGTTTTSNCSTVSGFTVIPEGAVYARFITFVGIASSDAYQTPYVGGFLTEADYDAEKGKFPYSDLKIACLGDSLTEGDIGSYDRSHPDVTYRNYPHWLAKEFGCKTLNYGKCGYTSEGYFNFVRGKNVDLSEADVILIMLGTNGGLKRNGVQQYNAYLLLLKQVRSLMKEGATIVLITPPHASANRPSIVDLNCQANVKEAAKTVLEIAEAEGLPVIDAHSFSPIQEAKENIYQPNDGLHMGEEGYRVFASYIASELRKILTAGE